MSNAGTNDSSGWVAGELIIAGPHVEFIFLLLSFSLINDMLWGLKSWMASWMQTGMKTKSAFYDNLNYRLISKFHFSFNPLTAALSICPACLSYVYMYTSIQSTVLLISHWLRELDPSFRFSLHPVTWDKRHIWRDKVYRCLFGYTQVSQGSDGSLTQVFAIQICSAPTV